MQMERCSAVSIAALVGMLIVSPEAKAETIRVQISNLIFSPADVTAHVGDTIEWTSTDFVAHTATARDKQWDVTIAPKGTGHVVLQHAGTIEYYCRFHPTMIGHITVAEH